MWNRKGITFLDQRTLGLSPSSIFIDRNNSLYTVNREKQQILAWHDGDADPMFTLTTKFYHSASLFVTSNGDIYIDNGEKNNRVEKWTRSTNQYSSILFVFSSCTGLFIDRNDHLYCSMFNYHHVLKVVLNDRVKTMNMAAGTGILGSASDQLNIPLGIFVDESLNLYVADCGNNRVQLFPPERVLGDTVVGRKSAQYIISLSCPSGVTLDAQNYLFIVDSNNHRIIRAGSNDIHCVVGCGGISFESIQLLRPSAVSFDRSGNMFVVDTGNHRIQKFQYSPNSCSKFD